MQQFLKFITYAPNSSITDAINPEIYSVHTVFFGGGGRGVNKVLLE
jgi:hypothetical protein